MKKSVCNAHFATFIPLVIAIRWILYLRSYICKCEGYTDNLIDTSRQTVSFVGDVILTRDDTADSMARIALRKLLSSSSEDVTRAERCLRDVGFPEPCTQLAVLCGASLDIQDSQRDIDSALTIINDTLSARLIEISLALHRDNKLDEAFHLLRAYLSKNGETSERTEKFVLQVKTEIATRLKELSSI